MYHQWLFSHAEIGEFFGVSRGAIEYQFNKHDIETRIPWEASALKRLGREKYKLLNDESWLECEYINKEKSAPEIADELGCSVGAVYDHLSESNIETRMCTREVTPETVENEPEELKRLNHEEGMSLQEIADKFDMSSGQMSVWFARHDIEVADNLPRGEDHHAYSGGRAKYGSGWTKTKKEKVRERDGRCCVNCGLSEERHKEIYGCKHAVHHIQKASSIDDDEKRNSMSNLVTLCMGQCHKKWEDMSPLRPQTQG